MATIDNKLVTNWLAAYCGDEQMFRRNKVIANVEDERGSKKVQWPLIDSDSQRAELVQQLFPQRPEKPDSSREQATTFEKGKLRAVLELISDRQFTIRGYLTDLSLESEFSERITNWQSKSKGGANEPERQESKIPDPFSEGRTPHYATRFHLESREFVAEVSVSDFATFEISGYVINPDDPKWNDNFRQSIQDFLSKLTP